MSKYFFFLLFIIIIFPYSSIFSQELENQIERIYDNTSGSSYSENEIDYIEYRRLNKLNLYYANKNDITQFPTFDIIIASKILDYVKNNPNANFAKLSKDLNLSSDQEIILDNCAIINKIIQQEFFFNSRTRNYQQFDKVYGFEKQKFLGSKLEYLQKVTSKYKNLEAGFVFDKDAGEMNFIDFYSGYLEFENNNTTFIVGDYYVELGLGNILSREFPSRKGSNVISPTMNFGDGIRPSRSSLDYSYFRGVALQNTFNFSDSSINLKVSLATSKTAKSGNLDTVSKTISSVYLSGLYRTPTEISKREVIDEKSIFGSVEMQVSDFLFGFGTFYLDYNYPIQSSSSSAFLGKNGLLKSVWARYLKNNFSIGGEASLDAKNNLGVKLGSIIDLDEYEIAFHLRSFSENYRSPYGSIFGEFSNPANELGLYSGIIYKKMTDWRISGFLDIYKSYARTYYVPAQVKGFNIFLESNYKISNDITLLNRIVYENKTDNIKQNNIDHIYQKQNISFRNDLSYQFSKFFYTRFRIESIFLDYSKLQSPQVGVGCFAEFNFLPLENLRLFTRISYFSTDSYDSAVWEYEYFILGMMNTYAAYLDGSRYLLGIKYNVLGYYRISLLYTNTSKNNLEELSSGNDRILSNSSNNLILQFEINL